MTNVYNHTLPSRPADCLPETRCFSDSITLVTGLRCTVKVWKSCGPWPTVSGCCTITRTVPELVPYAISIQFPLKPAVRYKAVRQVFILSENY